MMNITPSLATLTTLFHYGSVTLITVLSGLGVGLGQGISSYSAFKSIDRQPAAQPEISKTLVLALAIIETSAIISLIFTMILFFRTPTDFYSSFAQLGIALALGIPGFVIGIAAGLPAYAALKSISRQPFFSRKIMNAMLLTQSVIQTPVIFGFLVSMIIFYQLGNVVNMADALRLIASGLCIGVGAIGPAIGLGWFTYKSAQAIGINKDIYGQILSFTLISQAIIETPVIFSAIISLWISRIAILPTSSIMPGIVCLAAAIVMGIGTFAPGISSGFTAASAVNQIAYKPNLYGILAKTSMITQGLIDTCAIYTFIIALSLIIIGL